MLAERKKKVKWTINPRGNSWSKDTNKFGQRMLEKMGWKSGEGLGANKQGITEHIKVAYKNDNKCLGYKDNGEEWVEHQSQFESLLAELSSSHSTAATLDLVKDNISQNESLEERSRHSRTRVHYQKFTRGKDLSKYSEKDLKCIILGKQKANNAGEENEDNGGNEYFNEFYGVKTINSGNMNDYFKNLTTAQNYSDTYSSAVEVGEVDMSEKNNDVGEQCDVKVKEKRKRKAEVQVCGTENSNMDSNEALTIKQHEKKRKKCEILEHSNSSNGQLYTDYNNGNVSESKLQRQDVTDLDGILINGICNEELQPGEVCKEKRPKKQRNCGIQDKESELMGIDNEIEDKQVKTKSKKKNSELVNEGNESPHVPADVSIKSENSKPVAEGIDGGVDDEREVRQAKKKSKKKKPASSTEEKTSLVPVESVSHDSQNAGDTRLHLTAELNEIEGKEKKKKCKKKKRELTGDYGKTSVNTIEDVSHRLENSKDTEDYLSVEGKQLKKKSKKKKDLLNESREISILPAEDVSYRLENSKDTEQHLAVEVTDEIEGKQLKKKSEKKSCMALSECGGATVVPIQDNSQVLEISENITEHIMGKDEKLAKGTLGKDNHKIADINRFSNGTSSDNEVRSNEQTTEDVIRTKRKKKKNTKIESEKTVVEDIPKYVNDISVEKRRYKRKKDENEINGQSEQAELVMEEDKKMNADELQNVANSMHSSLQSTVNKNIAEELSEGCSKSPAKFHESYSVDEIKNMKLSLFTQLIDPRLIEFKGSNLHKIAGYGKS